MSAQTNTDGREPQEGLSEEEARRLVEQLRSTPAAQIVAEVFSTLLSAAQVKLGRRDARLFIDLCTVALDHAGPYVSEELRQQVESAVGQLRLGQVTAEKDGALRENAEANDLPQVPAPPRTGGPSGGSGAAQAPPSSRLWVPGT